MKQGFFSSSRLPIAGVCLVAAAFLSSCSNDTTTPSVGTPTAVAVSVAPAATSQVATAIPGPAVLVTGAGGEPVPGVLVKFTTTGGSVVQFPQATTDASGIASAGFLQVGPKVGPNVVTATVEGLPPLTFTVASQAGPAAAIGIFSGNGQSGAPGSTLASPLVVRITDAGGNVKSGATVTFAVTSGGGSLTTTSVTTDANGLGTSGSWKLSAGQCGQSVRATSGTLVADFTGSSRGATTIGATGAGALSATDCVVNGKFADEFDLTTAGEALNFTLNGTGFDGLAQVVTSDGTAIVASDDNSGGGTNAAFRLITATGSKAFRATSANAGETGDYSFNISTTSAAVTNCSPVYFEVGATTTQSVSPTDCTTGHGGVAGDVYLVFLAAGNTYRITQTAIPLDALTALYSPTGALIVERDNGGVGASGTETINITPSTSGFYKVVASSYCLVYDDTYQANCDYGAYTFSVIKP